MRGIFFFLLLVFAFALSGCGSMSGVRVGDTQAVKIPVTKLTDEVKVAEEIKVAEKIQAKVGYDRSSNIEARDYTSNNDTELMKIVFSGIMSVLITILFVMYGIIKRLMKRIEKLSEDKKE